MTEQLSDKTGGLGPSTDEGTVMGIIGGNDTEGKAPCACDEIRRWNGGTYFIRPDDGFSFLGSLAAASRPLILPCWPVAAGPLATTRLELAAEVTAAWRDRIKVMDHGLKHQYSAACLG
jgi:hypothetical protein